MKMFKKFTVASILLCTVFNMITVFAGNVTGVAHYESPNWPINTYISGAVINNWYGSAQSANVSCQVTLDPIDSANQVLKISKSGNGNSIIGHNSRIPVTLSPMTFAGSGRIYPANILGTGATAFAFMQFVNLASGNNSDFIRFYSSNNTASINGAKVASKILIRNDSSESGWFIVEDSYTQEWYDFIIVISIDEQVSPPVYNHTVYLNGVKYGPFDFLRAPNAINTVIFQSGGTFASFTGEAYLDDFLLSTPDGDEEFELVSTYPESDATGISCDKAVEFSYNEVLNPMPGATPDVTIIKTGDSGPATPSKVTIRGKSVLVEFPFEPLTEYTVSISGVESVFGYAAADSESTDASITYTTADLSADMPYTLSEITLSDISGVLEAIPASGNFTASLTATNNNHIGEAIIIMAAYDLESMLVDVKYGIPEENGAYSAAFNSGEVKKIKAFVWEENATVGLKPLSKHREYPKISD